MTNNINSNEGTLIKNWDGITLKIILKSGKILIYHGEDFWNFETTVLHAIDNQKHDIEIVHIFENITIAKKDILSFNIISK